MTNFSHIKQDQGQDQSHMVDVTHKIKTNRYARAQAYVHIPESLGEKLADSNWTSAKGPVFHTAIIAGTMAAKNTAALIPLCHSINISSVEIIINLINNNLIKIIARVKTCAQTGVEMEALSAASVAALTIYDMCKSYSSNLVIGDIRLVEKTGGKCDYLWTGARGGAELTDERSQGPSSAS